MWNSLTKRVVEVKAANTPTALYSHFIGDSVSKEINGQGIRDWPLRESATIS